MIRALPDSFLGAYDSKGKALALSLSSANATKQLAIFNVRAINNSGSTLSVGIVRSMVSGQFKLYNSVGAAITDISTAVAAATASGVFTVTNADGYYVASKRRFGLVGLTVSTAQAGGTFTYKYWNGSSFVTLTTIEVPSYATTGDKFVVFRAPNDWAVGATGLDSSMYAIQVLGSVAPAGTVSVNNVWVGEFLELYSGVVTNSAVQLSFPSDQPFELNGSEGLYPYFSTANAANAFGAYYVSI